MQRCEVLIVGGGPAGSTCAWLLKRAGIDVLVLDKKAFPRDKICAGWVTPAVVEELQFDVEDYRASGRTIQPIKRFRTGIIGDRVVETQYDEPVSYGIRRIEFDAYLLERSGALVAEPAQLKSLESSADGWLANGSIEGRFIVGAGGHFCPVARHIGAKLGHSEIVVAAQEVEFPMTDAQKRDCAAEGDKPELYFCADLKGYGWVFRKGEYLNVGLGREDNHKLSEHVADFVHWLKATRRIPQDSPEKFGGHAYLLYNQAPRPFLAERAMLIGDAAGLAYPKSGEGIRPAVESAIFAAETLIAARGDYSAAKLAGYETKMIERFGTRQAKSLTDRLPAGLRKLVAVRLFGSEWFTRNFLIDEWFLHAKQAALRA